LVWQAERFRFSNLLLHFLVVVVFEVDKKKETFPVTGKMKVEVPADCSEQELKEIENVLAKTIATSLDCNPEQIEVTIDPETGEAIFVVKTNDPSLAEEMHKKVSHKDFATNVNTGISEHSEHLPEKIREVLGIHTVNVNYSLFSETIHSKTISELVHFFLSLSKFDSNSRLIPNWGSNIHYNIKQTLLHPPKLLIGMASRTFQIFQFTVAFWLLLFLRLTRKKKLFQ
jgi:hypothetical protein